MFDRKYLELFVFQIMALRSSDIYFLGAKCSIPNWQVTEDAICMTY